MFTFSTCSLRFFVCVTIVWYNTHLMDNIWTHHHIIFTFFYTFVRKIASTKEKYFLFRLTHIAELHKPISSQKNQQFYVYLNICIEINRIRYIFRSSASIVLQNTFNIIKSKRSLRHWI